MILRTAGGKAKNGITSCHARRQEGAMEGYLLPLPHPAHLGDNTVTLEEPERG